MLKTNVITKAYKLTALTPLGFKVSCTVQAESEAAAKLKHTFPDGCKITEVVEL